MALSEAQLRLLTARWQDLLGRLSARTVDQVGMLWDRYGGVDDAAQRRFARAAAEVVEAAQRQAAMLADAYIRTYTAGLDGTTIGATVDLASATSQRGVAAVEVYARPAITARTALAGGKDFAEAFRVARTRATSAADVDVKLAARSAARDSMVAAGYTRYRRVPDGTACTFCLVASTQAYNTGDLMPLHNRCVVGGTVVSSVGADLATCRWYEGEGVVLVTASGHELTVTPNHPVLTSDGWIPAGLLHEGDHVLGSVDGQRVRGRVPHEHEAPTRIEDVFRALSVAGLVAMPLSAEDFHGDVPASQIDVVAPDRYLRDCDQAALGEHLGQAFLTGGFEAAALLTRASGAHEANLWLSDPSHGLVGRGRHGRTLCRRHALVQELASRTAVADRDPRFSQVSHDHVPGHAVTLGDREHRLATLVAGDYVGKVNPAGPRFDPSESHLPSERRVLDADSGGRLLDRLTGQVEADRLVLVRRVHLATHVYNLQTTEGWFSANGIIVSNCGCTVAPLPADAPHVIDRDLLARLKAASGRDDYWNDPKAAAVVREHGELGPVLVHRGDRFTTAAEAAA